MYGVLFALESFGNAQRHYRTALTLPKYLKEQLKKDYIDFDQHLTPKALQGLFLKIHNVILEEVKFDGRHITCKIMLDSPNKYLELRINYPLDGDKAKLIESIRNRSDWVAPVFVTLIESGWVKESGYFFLSQDGNNRLRDITIQALHRLEL